MLYINIIFLTNIRKFKFENNEKILLSTLIIFWLFICLSSLNSGNILFSLKSSFLYIRFILFGSAVYFYFSLFPNQIIKLFRIILLSLFILSLDSLLQYFYGYNVMGYSKYGMRGIYDSVRLGSLMGDELVLGSYMSKFFILIFSINFVTEGKKKLWINFFLVLIFFVIFLSGERQAFYFSIISLILILLITFNKNFLSIVFVVITSFILFTVISKSDQNIKDRMINPIYVLKDLDEKVVNILNYFNSNINLMNNEPENGKLNDSIELSDKNYKNEKLNQDLIIFSPDHTNHYKVALAMFLDKKFIGQGPRTFRLLCKEKNFKIFLKDPRENACSTHPHNFYFQLLAETGIIGFLCLIILFCYLTFFVLKMVMYNVLGLNIRISQFTRLYFILPAMLLFPFMPNGNFFNNYLNMTLYFLFALCAMFIKLEKNNIKFKVL
tara:strand:- start:528 stop:1844 length:1317 start_codon:yes stop_codon:yes gene_type:complete